MGDVAAILILVLLGWLGARRGARREVVEAVGALAASSAALTWGPRLGPELAGRTAWTAGLAYGVALAGTWALVYGTAVFGLRRLWRKPEVTAEGWGVTLFLQQASAAASRVVDALVGGLLGVLKGALITGITLFAASDVEVQGVCRVFEGSWVRTIYAERVVPTLTLLPEVRIARAAGGLVRAGQTLRAHPERLERLSRHPELVRIREDARVAALADDEDLALAAREHRIDDILRDPRVRALATDSDLLRLLARLDVDRVLRDLARPEPPVFLFPTPAHDASGTGEVVTGLVVSVSPEGAVVSIDEDDPVHDRGVIRPADITWTRRDADPAGRLLPGDRVRAAVLARDPASGRLALGLRQLEPDPWPDLVERLEPGADVEATVARIEPHQTTLLLEGDVEALLPPAWSDGLSDGQRLRVRIEAVSSDGRRVWVRR